MTIFCSLPVARSLAETCVMRGVDVEADLDLRMPRGAGGIPINWNLPRSCCKPQGRARPGARGSQPTSVVVRRREDLALPGWDSGIPINEPGEHAALGFDTKESGVTSRRMMSLTSPASTPPWIAAPKATTSSGLMPLWGSLPVSERTFSCTAGMRVMPPTRMTWSMSRS